MRHRKRGRILGRERAARRALTAALAQSLVRRGSITTTLAKAKEVRPEVERLVTLARSHSLHHRRQILQRVRDPKLARTLIDTIGPRFAQRPGGYTRIVRLGTRAGDRASMARLEFVQ